MNQDHDHKVGTGVGAASGALAGPSAAAVVNRPYADYRPAYRYGWESHARLGNRPFRDVEHDLERGWDLAKKESSLAWTQAKHAAGDAWRRLEAAASSDATPSGR